MTKNNHSQGSLYNTISFACMVCFLFFLGELITRVFITFPVSTIPDRELGWLRKPNSVYLHSKEGRAINNFNSLGFNDREVSETKSKNSTLLILGDSFVEALHVPKSKNFTSLVENQAKCINIFNAGRADLSPIQYHALAKRLSKILLPKAIILTVNYGDFADIERNNAKIIRDQNTGNIKNIILNETKLHSLRIKVDDISSKSSLLTFLGRRLKRINSPLNQTSDTDKAFAISEQQKQKKYQTIQDILEYKFEIISSIAPLYVLYIPDLEYQPNGKSVPTIESDKFEQMITGITNKKKIPFLSVKAYMQEVYRKTNQPPVGFPNNNILTGHFNEIGHQTVASTLLKLLDIECIDRLQEN